MNDDSTVKATLQQAVYRIRVLGYLLYKAGFMISSGSRRKMGNVAKQIDVPLGNVERVLAWAMEWVFYQKIFTSVHPGSLAYGVDEVDGSVAEKLIEYYLSKQDALPLTESLRRELDSAAKETDVSIEVVAAILEPIYQRLLMRTFRDIPKPKRIDEPIIS